MEKTNKMLPFTQQSTEIHLNKSHYPQQLNIAKELSNHEQIHDHLKLSPNFVQY